MEKNIHHEKNPPSLACKQVEWDFKEMGSGLNAGCWVMRWRQSLESEFSVVFVIIVVNI